MVTYYNGFERHELKDGQAFFVGELPEGLRFDAAGFEELWCLHPGGYHVIKMHGRAVATPRWQQAYGADYHYTGQTNRALPVPPILGSGGHRRAVVPHSGHNAAAPRQVRDGEIPCPAASGNAWITPATLVKHRIAYSDLPQSLVSYRIVEKK